MDSEDDLYAVLGVESGAPADAIKAAYRNLVREHHPDRKQLTPEDIAEADARMATLNRAWEVLSNPARRRLYDEQRYVDELLRRRPVPASADRERAGAPPGEVAASNAAHAASLSQAHGAEGEHTRSAASLQASHRLRERILTTRPTFRWERDTLHGFEWALAGRAFLSYYAAALRFEETLDPESAARFVMAARAALHGGRAKGKHALFLLLVERAEALERVRSMLKDFSAGEDGSGCTIVVVDATRSRSLLCSGPPGDDRMANLLALLGI